MISKPWKIHCDLSIEHSAYLARGTLSPGQFVRDISLFWEKNRSAHVTKRRAIF
jgi:hypothetical protein